MGKYFNPRTREGCDGRLPPALLLEGISIHAPVKGATQTAAAAALAEDLFQSTHP